MQPNVLSAGSLTSAHPFRCALPCGQVLSAVHLRDDGLLAQRVVLVRSEGSHLMETSLVESDESERAAHSVRELGPMRARCAYVHERALER